MPTKSKPTLLAQFIQTRDRWLIGGVVVLAFLLRLHGITSQPTDWHAFRQADTASVTREYVKHGIDLLHPHYQDLSNIQSGKDNLEGWRMVEFPFLNAMVAFALRVVPHLDLATTSRLLGMAFALGVTWNLWFIGKTWSGRAAGLLAALSFAVMPYARYYSRAILPEIPLVFFFTLTIVAFELWLHKQRWQWYVLAMVSFALACLLKPFVVFFLPVFGVMAIQKYGWKVWQRIEFIPLVAVGLLALWWWRRWILQFPSGIPANDWLFNGDGIRWRPAWFRWLGWERFTKLILGFAGVPLVALGLLPVGKAWPKYVAWWLGVLVYFSVIATGNVRHDYYQVIILPIVCLTVGLGGAWIWHYQPQRVPAWMRGVIITTFLVTMTFVANHWIQPYYRTRPDWEKAGQAADKILPADAKVIAPAFGDTAFLFQTNRTGWPIGFEIEDKRAKGAQFYVTTANDDEARMLKAQYPTLTETPDYIILDLRTPLATPSTSSASKR